MKTIKNILKLWIMTLAALYITGCDDPSAHLPETPEVEILSSQSLLFPREGGVKSISFETNRPWTARLLNETDWVTFTPEKGNAGRHEIVITVTEQPAGADFREVILVINSSASGKDIHVMQSGKPIVSTFNATGVSETSATLNGAWVYGGEDITVTEYGFALNAGEGTFEKKAVESRDEATGTFALDLKELQPETAYTYHSYVVTSENEEICGEDVQFVTPAAPVDKTIAGFKTHIRTAVEAGKTGILSENFIVYGTVLSSYVPAADLSGSSDFPAKEAYIQINDAAAANSGLTLYFKNAADNVYKTGDLLKIRMKDSEMIHRASGSVAAYITPGQIEVTGTGEVMEAIVINHTEISAYEAMPVKIENTQMVKVHTTDGTEKWGDTNLWTLEVENSDITYQMYIASDSELAGQPKETGSGYISGIVLAGSSEFAVQANAVSLKGERFISLLEPRFTELGLDLESLIIGVENELELSLKYENGGSKVINGSDIKITSNVDFTAEIESTYTLKKNNGSLKIIAKVTPVDYTPVSFTVTGFLDGEHTAQIAVTDPVVVDKGNFEATWTIVGKNSESAGSSNNDAVSVTSILLTGKQSNYSDANAATAFDANDASNKLTSPATYFETSVTVTSGTLDIWGFSYDDRSSIENVKVSVQYSTGSAQFKEIAEYEMGEEKSGSRSFDLQSISDLQSLAAGTVVRFRIVPMSSASKDKYGIRNTAAPSLWGNVK